MERHKDCPWCKQTLPEGFYEAKADRKAKRIKRVLKERQAAGLHVGRPVEHDYEKIISLRKAGFTMRQIADKIGCSTYTVQRALGFPSGRKQ